MAMALNSVAGAHTNAGESLLSPAAEFAHFAYFAMQVSAVSGVQTSRPV